MIRPLLYVLAACALAGCDQAAGDTGQAQVRDSAGVRLVRASLTEATPRWTLAERPSLVAGSEDGPPGAQLDRVRGALRTADGGVVVLSAGTHALVFFDRAGRFVRAAGGRGGGPGEFESPVSLARLRGDSLAVWDGGQRRLSVFGPDGTHARDVSVQADPGSFFPEVRGVFADGGFVLTPGASVAAMMEGEGSRRDPLAFIRFGADGAPLDTLGTFPGDETFLVRRESGFAWDVVPFGSRTVGAGGPGAFAVANSGSNEIAVFDASGKLARVVHGPFQPRPVTRGDVDRYRERRLAVAADPQRRREAELILAAAPVPERAPAFGSVLVDARDRLWVQEYPLPGATFAAWAVIDADGRVAGRVEIPVDFQLTDVGDDHVVARVKDELDVERVHVYALRRDG